MLLTFSELERCRMNTLTQRLNNTRTLFTERETRREREREAEETTERERAFGKSEGH